MPFLDRDGPRRVLLVGWDGACWELLDRLLAEGRLPHLEALIRTGFRSALESTIPPVTPPSWSAMATGLGPGRTGILGFREFDFSSPSGFSPRLTNSHDLEGRTLFELFAEQGESLSLVGWPMTWPPFPIPGSVVVAGWPRPQTSEVPVWPRALARRLGPWGDEAPPSTFGASCVEDEIARASWWDRRHAEIACKLLRERDDGLVAVVFSGTDHLSHSLWGDDRLDEHFERVDTHLGELLRAAGKSVTTVLVSDHGFGPAATEVIHLGRWLEREGLLQLQPDERPDPLGLVARKIRTSLPSRHWKKIRDRLHPSIRQWGFERASDATRIDMQNTRVHRVSLYEGWEGLVCPRLTSLERRDLVGALVELDSVRRVHRAEDVFEGAPQGSVPELVVELEPSFRGGERLGAGPLIEPNSAEDLRRCRATHRREGILVAAGPGVKAGLPPRGAQVVDVGCNVLALAGATLPDDLDGRVWVESLSAAVRYVPASSKEMPSDWRVDEGAEGGQPTRSDRAQLEQQLRDLGYA